MNDAIYFMILLYVIYIAYILYDIIYDTIKGGDTNGKA